MSIRTLTITRPLACLRLRESFFSSGFSASPYVTSASNFQSNIPNQKNELPWSEYFTLRTQRRRYEKLFQIPTTAAAFVGGGIYFANMVIDPTQTVMGLDPLMVNALGTVVCGFAGWLVGPVIGSQVFGVINRRTIKDVDTRDREFYQHLVRNRADARTNSIRNPVPDYYGEKINSVADYRAWLRRQREHTRKATFGGKVEEED